MPLGIRDRGIPQLGASSWEDDEAMCHRDIVTEFADKKCWTFVPMRAALNVNVSKRPDPTRPVFQAPCIFDWDSKDINMPVLTEMDVTLRVPCLHAQICDMKWVPNVGDQVVRELTGDMFEIKSVKQDSTSGVDMELNQMGREA